jgi:hypothetical protein
MSSLTEGVALEGLKSWSRAAICSCSPAKQNCTHLRMVNVLAVHSSLKGGIYEYFKKAAGG